MLGNKLQSKVQKINGETTSLTADLWCSCIIIYCAIYIDSKVKFGNFANNLTRESDSIK